jgi:hypothetical protein
VSLHAALLIGLIVALCAGMFCSGALVAVTSGLSRAKRPWRTRDSVESVQMIGPKRAGTPLVQCGACATWFPTQSSSLGGQVACQACGTTLVLNPLVIEGDWRPIAKAWQGRKSGDG